MKQQTFMTTESTTSSDLEREEEPTRYSAVFYLSYKQQLLYV